MNADGSEPVNLTDSPESREKWPAWSPDGARIAFSRTTNDGPRDIYTINADGTGLVNLTQHPGRNDDVPLWSPDGSRLMFTAEWLDAPTNPEIFVMTLALELAAVHGRVGTGTVTTHRAFMRVG